jgi:uncharacterized membrane protein
MNGSYQSPGPVLPAVGCAGTFITVLLLCLMPYFLVGAMESALDRLHLAPALAVPAVIGIFVGGLINIPVYRVPRVEEQPVEAGAVYGYYGWSDHLLYTRPDTIIAVNVGGCIIPTLIAAWQLLWLFRTDAVPLSVLGLAVAVNTLVCYLVARPVRGVGITMPGLVSPLVSVGLTWLLLPGPEFAPVRPAVAFVAGVSGPLLGADLMHLKDITRMSTGILSIGGAGTFDGIVLSGVLAALLV